MRKVLIAAGGTGGHLFPALQLARELQGSNVLFAGHKLEGSPFFDKAFAFCEIESAARNPWKLFKGFIAAIRLVLAFKPDVVVGFGSFHSLPILMAAKILRKKIVLFEPNTTFGLVNRLFAGNATCARLLTARTNDIYMPLPQVIRVPRSYGLKENVFTILVFGGSQGAKYLNETFFEAAKLLDFPFQVIHFTGKELELVYSVPSVVKPFEKEMHKAYSSADMVISRAGANTIAELIAYQLPALLIPYPFAYNHQIENAKILQEGAVVLLQKNASPEKMAAEIKAIRQNLAAHKQALCKLQREGGKKLSEICRELI
jgi:UDP-N-acetylglucosamine--N-acetylmuramyl-(pentapeptide) pyrophosphoryl-undecaprenol N-acetylglucosamine transferase